jgi:heptaprenyl diphosphate synthase
MNQKLKRLMIIAMMLSLAIIVNYMETFIPVFVPGVRLGLANVIILIMLYEFNFYETFIVDLLRIFIVSLIRGTFLAPVFFMSLSGGMLSLFGMFILSKAKIFSAIGVSSFGAILHTLGQILALIIIVSNYNVINYVPIIGLLSVLTGILSGLIAHVYLIRSITYNYVLVNTKYKEKYAKPKEIIDENATQ